MYIDMFELLENCKRIATRDILVCGEKKDAEYWFKVATDTFITPAVDSVAHECQIVIDDIKYDGIVMIHKDGRVYPMMRDSYNKIYG